VNLGIISMKRDGSRVVYARGMRSPLGMTSMKDKTIWINDNQVDAGDLIPAGESNQSRSAVPLVWWRQTGQQYKRPLSPTA
jgi:glucose/arabinose dehydrogenase